MGDLLSGGGGDDPYVSPNVGASETGATESIYNRIGAKRKKPTTQGGLTIQGGGASSDGGGVGAGEWDFSDVAKPLTGKAGLATAKAPYDFSPINEAIQGYRNPASFTQTYSGAKYKPYKFNFGQLPQEYTDKSYQLGASDINREGKNATMRAQEATGTRRPGLLMKSIQDIGRDTGANLAKYRTNLDLNRINQNVELGKSQQLAQAGENFGATGFNAGEQYKAYGSRSDLEKANAANKLQYLNGLMSAGTSKIGTESGLLGQERNYQDQAIQYLLDLYKTQTGQAQNAAQLNAQKQNSSMGFLGDVAGIASMAAPFFCLPEGTPITTEAGSIPVQEVKLGDKVAGGRVVALSRRARPLGHVFSKHIFETGEVLMTHGHPYHDKLISVEPGESNSPVTCDILTDSGFYYVNGVKLGSTIRK